MDIFKTLTTQIATLKKNPANVKDYGRFHRDDRDHVGLSAPLVRKLSAEYWKEVKALDKKQVFALCEKLLQTGDMACQGIAFDWAHRLKRRYTPEDFTRFEKWVGRHVDSWSSCDDLCSHGLGEFVYKFPEVVPRVKQWTKSKNMWFRRAAAVALIYSVRRGRYIADGFEVATLLLHDKEDLVQKGYGWMLKEMCRTNEKDVFDFVMKHKATMPRTALRYAIEKMGERMKATVMN